MTFLLVGYGRMGREVESVLTTRGHEVSARIDPVDEEADCKTLSTKLLESADAAIEFSLADAVLTNAELYLQTNTPAVVGTTGWENQRDEVASLFAKKGSYLWGSNFSVGVQIFLHLVEKTTAMADKLGTYDVLSYEIHHKHKKDSPSGTALTVGERILRGASNKTRIVTSRLDRPIEPEEVHVSSVRGGSIQGIHTLLLDSEVDTIEMKHSAKNRGGFALGAVLATEWLIGRKGFYSVEDFFAATMNS